MKFSINRTKNRLRKSVLFRSTFIKLLIKGILTSNKRHSAQLFFIYIINNYSQVSPQYFRLTEIIDLTFPESRSEFSCNQFNEMINASSQIKIIVWQICPSVHDFLKNFLKNFSQLEYAIYRNKGIFYLAKREKKESYIFSGDKDQCLDFRSRKRGVQSYNLEGTLQKCKTSPECEILYLPVIQILILQAHLDRDCFDQARGAGLPTKNHAKSAGILNLSQEM